MPPKVIIAQQLFHSLGKLTANEQARVIDFINTFQDNPAHPGVSLERLVRTNSKNLWSGRVSRDLRTILHKDGDTWAILYVDHHDAAYNWAKRRDIGRHSVTGALQIVESVETVREVERTIEVFVGPDKPPLFEGNEDAYLLSLGVPENWLPTLRRVQDDDQLLTVCEKLPEDVAERLLTLASGELVTPPKPVSVDQPAIEAIDTRRRFFLVEDADGLRAALEEPMERWIAFLHPSQRDLVEREFSGPAKVSGSAGTGKTVVAMHRARYLARKGEKVLLTSYVTTLCDNIQRNLSKLCSEKEQKQIQVSTVHKEAFKIVRKVEPRLRPASEEEIRNLLDKLRIRHAPHYDQSFVQAEWDNVVRLQGMTSWDEYRQARRTGRGQGLSVKERKLLWRVFGCALKGLAKRNLTDWTGLCRRATELLSSGSVSSPYTAIIVDEVQDLKPPELRFIKMLGTKHPGNLMVCGDAGQRIYPGGFSLNALGIEVRGRSTVLRLNYRTTEQIRQVADRMLGQTFDNMEGGLEQRKGARSLLRGPTPRLIGYSSAQEEIEAGINEIRRWLKDGLAPEAIGVFARTGKQINALSERLQKANILFEKLSKQKVPPAGAVQIGTMHRAKGLEFKTVLVLGCSSRELPNPAALRGVKDRLDQEAAEAMERRLLYVAMTRARDELTVSWNGKPSRFLEELVNDGKGECR